MARLQWIRSYNYPGDPHRAYYLTQRGFQGELLKWSPNPRDPWDLTIRQDGEVLTATTYPRFQDAKKVAQALVDQAVEERRKHEEAHPKYSWKCPECGIERSGNIPIKMIMAIGAHTMFKHIDEQLGKDFKKAVEENERQDANDVMATHR